MKRKRGTDWGEVVTVALALIGFLLVFVAMCWSMWLP